MVLVSGVGDTWPLTGSCSVPGMHLSDFQSKETYGQTRGLSNLEMKHVGKLAIIGALLKAVKTSKRC